jgi:hypothetical protein
MTWEGRALKLKSYGENGEGEDNPIGVTKFMHII